MALFVWCVKVPVEPDIAGANIRLETYHHRGGPDLGRRSQPAVLGGAGREASRRPRGIPLGEHGPVREAFVAQGGTQHVLTDSAGIAQSRRSADRAAAGGRSREVAEFGKHGSGTSLEDDSGVVPEVPSDGDDDPLLMDSSNLAAFAAAMKMKAERPGPMASEGSPMNRYKYEYDVTILCWNNEKDSPEEEHNYIRLDNC
ncbi:conserved hypothetical protein [Culex quinquefasciatus]|uniref:Uncharacterized protein n=1 Tax=Culex quinquefasciatus TaxID=7176 RepID=B0W947_CULQU|nr:conserved hypothetical protein [Culex quinquefasciatus]|eukprot:XP_001845231.1 conserved hypothetical protein [Culex quinquefasciatus]